MMKSGVVTRGSQKSGEFSMYWFGETHIDLPNAAFDDAGATDSTR